MAAVPSVLAPYVTSLVAYDIELGEPGVHRGLPSTSLTLVLPMCEPLDVGWADGRARGTRWSTVSGLGPKAYQRVARFEASRARSRRQADVMTAAETKLWHTMAVRDADRMMAWLTVIGFTEHATYRDESDPSVVTHAEWLWPGGGGLMFGSQRPDAAVDNVGGSAAYLVTDDVDGVFARAVEAGATVEREVVEQDYGGRGGSVADPEGNHWSFGSYQPS